MAATTAFQAGGYPGRPYGSFAGKEASVVPPVVPPPPPPPAEPSGGGYKRWGWGLQRPEAKRKIAKRLKKRFAAAARAAIKVEEQRPEFIAELLALVQPYVGREQPPRPPSAPPRRQPEPMSLDALMRLPKGKALPAIEIDFGAWFADDEDALAETLEIELRAKRALENERENERRWTAAAKADAERKQIEARALVDDDHAVLVKIIAALADIDADDEVLREFFKETLH